jgi:hypothetical protein
MAKDKDVPTFSKSQIVDSDRYKGYADLLNAILKTDKTYTLETVDGEIQKFMGKKVK